MIASFLYYKLGKWLGGKATSTEIFSVVSYSYIPIIIGLSIIFLLKKTTFLSTEINNTYSRNTVQYISWFLSLKILGMGMVKFNKYGLKKGIVNILPIIIFYVAILLLYLL